MTGLSPFAPGQEPMCPICGSKAVEKGLSNRTLMSGTSGYDDEGKYHNHDPNWTRTTYTCEEGHKFMKRSRSSCMVDGCDFGGEVEYSVVDK